MDEHFSYVVIAFIVCLTSVGIYGCHVNHEAEMKCLERGKNSFYINGKCFDEPASSKP